MTGTNKDGLRGRDRGDVMHKNVLLDWIAEAEERHVVEAAAARRSACRPEMEMLVASDAPERNLWRRFTIWLTVTAHRPFSPISNC